MLKRLLLLPFAAASLAACAEATAPAGPAVAAPMAAAVRPAKLGLCVACHGENGRSRVPGTPHLGGQDRQYLERALSDYRNGQRRHVPMSSVANSLQPADVRALSAWYAAQAGFQGGVAR